MTFIFGVSSYISIFLGIRRERGEGQSFCSWVLWLMLDVTLMIPTYQKGETAVFFLLSASFLGSLVISFYLFRLKKIQWGKNEIVSLSLVIVTSLLWILSEYGRNPIIKDKDLIITIGVIAQVIAGWPLTKESWQRPKPIYIAGYLFFIAGCIPSLVIEKNIFDDFDIGTHLFPLALGIQTVIDIAPLVGKLFSNLLNPAP